MRNSSIRLAWRHPVGHFPDKELVWEGSGHYGQCHPWAGGPGLYEKGSWARQGNQPASPWSLLQCLPLGSCLAYVASLDWLSNGQWCDDSGPSFGVSTLVDLWAKSVVCLIDAVTGFKWEVPLRSWLVLTSWCRLLFLVYSILCIRFTALAW